MLHFLALHWIVICVVGIILNFGALISMSESQPEGAMGMGIILPFCLVPYLIFIPTVLDKFGLMPKG